MPSVRVRENEYFDAALRRFKRACEKAGILTELRRREFYEKPTQERKRKKAAAIKRHMKRVSRDGMRASAASGCRADGHDAEGTHHRRHEDARCAPARKSGSAPSAWSLAAIKQREVDERIRLDDTQVLAVLEKMIKQRRESITQFESGGRADLVAKEMPRSRCCRATCPRSWARRSRCPDRRRPSPKPAPLRQGHGQGHGAGEAQGRRAAPTWAPSAPGSSRNCA